MYCSLSSGIDLEHKNITVISHWSTETVRLGDECMLFGRKDLMRWLDEITDICSVFPKWVLNCWAAIAATAEWNQNVTGQQERHAEQIIFDVWRNKQWTFISEQRDRVYPCIQVQTQKATLDMCLGSLLRTKNMLFQCYSTNDRTGSDLSLLVRRETVWKHPAIIITGETRQGGWVF